MGLKILRVFHILDIKPYVPDIDGIKSERIGWLSIKPDNRFI